MKVALAALALLLGVGARAETTLRVRRGDLPLRVRVTGTIVVVEPTRLKASIEGRVEDVLVSTFTWAKEGAPLGHLANKEMAAILDARSPSDPASEQKRWREVYAPTPIRCPWDCFVLRSFVKNREWLKPRALLFEVARLQAVGRVRPEEAHLVREGQTIELWPRDQKGRKVTAKVRRFELDPRGSGALSGATVTVDMKPGGSLDPGTDWEGHIIPIVRKGVMMVPTDAILSFGGATYLPVRVSTGATTESWTEITAGVDDKREVLVIDDARLKEAVRHAPQVDEAALRRRLYEEETRGPAGEEIKPRRRVFSLPDPDDSRYAEDPYAE